MTYQFDFSALLPYWREFAEGVWLTLQLSAVSTVFGFIGGAPGRPRYYLEERIPAWLGGAP